MAFLFKYRLNKKVNKTYFLKTSLKSKIKIPPSILPYDVSKYN